MSHQTICKSGSHYVRTTEIDDYGSTSRVLRSFGVKCIGVQGKDSMFILTRDKDQDIKRLHDCMESILLAYVVDQLRAIRKEACADMYPFGVVHMPLCVVGIDEPSLDARVLGEKEEATVNFLEATIKGGSGFDFGKTLQTAMQALQILVGEKLTAEDIQVVYVVKDNMNAKTLKISKIEDHLTKINGEG